MHIVVLIGDASSRSMRAVETTIVIIFFTSCMIAYVAYFTVLRFKREAEEKKEFNKIRNLTLDDALELAQDMKDIIT